MREFHMKQSMTEELKEGRMDKVKHTDKMGKKKSQGKMKMILGKK
tara:strand:- start:4320 stop:4454 length:135 start_codon:yes stop_codon:yes gene_type:complete